MAMTARIEALLFVVGLALIVIAAAAYDWRLGAAFAGLIIIASLIDFKVPRR